MSIVSFRFYVMEILKKIPGNRLSFKISKTGLSQFDQAILKIHSLDNNYEIREKKAITVKNVELI